MNFQTQSWLLNRRHVLRGLGASIALPMLDCMRSARAADGPKPKRGVFIYLPNGVNTLDYQILQSGADYEFSKCLKPLEKHRANITPISGLHHPNGIGNHHGCQKIWLSGGELGQGKRNSISIDQLIAERTAEHTRFASLELSNDGRALSSNRDGIRLPAEAKPSEIFKRLFEAPEGGAEKERLALQQQGSILDAVLDEANQLDRKMGAEDRTRLDQYLTSVREVEIRTRRAESWLDVARPVVEERTKARLTKSVSQSDPGEYFRVMYDLIVLAFETDMTRVATFSTGDEGKGLPIPELGINQTRHALSHHNGDPAQLARLTQSDAFNYEQFAYFLNQLADRQLLDSTIALFGSGMAYGHSHGNANIPTVVAGGAGLGLKHGSHIDFNQGHFDGYDLDNAKGHYQICSRPLNADARISNLLLTLGQKLDVEADNFGDSLTTISELG
ncbi:MAG: DUF1552 domain-containing protein [Verrucomicrobiota bacterium]